LNAGLDEQDFVLKALIERAEQVRRKVTRVMPCDANLAEPVGGITWQYNVLVSNFCAESATDDREQWRRFVQNITSLLRPDGRLVLAALKGADSYSVGDKVFPAVYILEDDLRQVLRDTGFCEDSIHIESVPADRPSRHYEGLMLATATKCMQNGDRKG